MNPHPLTTGLAEVLAWFRENLRGSKTSDSDQPWNDLALDHSSSSPNERAPNGRRGPLRTNDDDLRDVKFDPPNCKSTLNLDVYLGWIQTSERFFDVKRYSDEKSFMVAIHKLKKYMTLWYGNTKGQRAEEGKLGISTWSKLKKLMHKRFLPEGCERGLHLKASSLNQGRMSVEKYIREFKQLKIRSGLEEEPKQDVVSFL